MVSLWACVEDVSERSFSLCLVLTSLPVIDRIVTHEDLADCTKEKLRNGTVDLLGSFGDATARRWDGENPALSSEMPVTDF